MNLIQLTPRQIASPRNTVTSFISFHFTPFTSFLSLIPTFLVLLTSFPYAQSSTVSTRTLIDEQSYRLCSESSSPIISENKWTQLNSSYNSQCIASCGHLQFVLGNFSPSTILTRRFYIPYTHSSIRITGTFVKLDGWSLGQTLIIQYESPEIESNPTNSQAQSQSATTIFTWEFTGDDVSDINLCDINLQNTLDHIESFNSTFPHTSNLLTLSILVTNSNSETISSWGLLNFSLLLEQETDLDSQSQPFHDLHTLTAAILTNSNLPEFGELPVFYITFSNPLAETHSNLIESDISISISNEQNQNYDNSTFATQIYSINSTTFRIAFTRLDFSLTDSSLTVVTFSYPLLDISGIALQNLSLEATSSKYYAYSDLEQSLIKLLRTIISNSAIALLSLTGFITLIFDNFNMLAYSTDIGSILYISSFINVTFPANVQLILQACSVFLLQSNTSASTSSNAFSSIIQKETDLDLQKPYFTHFQQLGVTSLFIQNSGNLIGGIILILITVGLLCFLSHPKTPFVQERTKETIRIFIDKRIKYRLIFAIIYFSYSQILFYSLIQIFTWNLTSFIEILSMILAIITLSFSILVPIVLYRFISNHTQEISLTEMKTERQIDQFQFDEKTLSIFKKKFSILWEGLRIESQQQNQPELKKNSLPKQTIISGQQIIIKNPQILRTSYFYLILILRRSLFSCIVVLFQFNSNLQIALLNICNVTIAFFIIFTMPKTKPRHNYKILITEFLLIFKNIIMQSFQNANENEDSRLLRGWIISTAILLIFTLHFIFLAQDILEALLNWFNQSFNINPSFNLSSAQSSLNRTKTQLINHPKPEKQKIYPDHFKKLTDPIVQVDDLRELYKKQRSQFRTKSTTSLLLHSDSHLIHDMNTDITKLKSSTSRLEIPFSSTHQNNLSQIPTIKSQKFHTNDHTGIEELLNHPKKQLPQTNSAHSLEFEVESISRTNKRSLTSKSPNYIQNINNSLQRDNNSLASPNKIIIINQEINNQTITSNTNQNRKQTMTLVSLHSSPTGATLITNQTGFSTPPNSRDITNLKQHQLQQNQQPISARSISRHRLSRFYDKNESLTQSIRENTSQSDVNSIIFSQPTSKQCIHIPLNQNAPSLLNISSKHLSESESQSESSNTSDSDSNDEISNNISFQQQPYRSHSSTLKRTDNIAQTFKPSGEIKGSLIIARKEKKISSMRLLESSNSSSSADSKIHADSFHHPRIKKSKSEKTIKFNLEINHKESDQQADSTLQINSHELLAPPQMSFFDARRFQRPSQTIQEMPGEENGSIMGLSSNVHTVAESPLDLNPDRRRMMMSALMKMQFNVPMQQSTSGTMPIEAMNRRHSDEIDEKAEEESIEIENSIIIQHAEGGEDHEKETPPNTS